MSTEHIPDRFVLEAKDARADALRLFGELSDLLDRMHRLGAEVEAARWARLPNGDMDAESLIECGWWHADTILEAMEVRVGAYSEGHPQPWALAEAGVDCPAYADELRAYIEEQERLYRGGAA